MRTVLAIVALATVIAACDAPLNQTTVYTSSPTQTITGVAPSRDNDPVVSVDVNGVAAGLNGSKYSATIPLDGSELLNPVLAVFRYQSGFTAQARGTVAYADGTHAVLVPSGSTVSGGEGTAVTTSGLAKLVADAAADLTIDPSALAFPSTSVDCPGSACLTLTPHAAPTIGGRGVTPTLVSLPTLAPLGVEVELPQVTEQIDVAAPDASCVLTVTYPVVTADGAFAVSVPSPGTLQIAPVGDLATPNVGARTGTGCEGFDTTDAASLVDALHVTDGVVRSGAHTMLTAQTAGATPVSAALQTSLGALDTGTTALSVNGTSAASIVGASVSSNGLRAQADVRTSSASAEGSAPQPDSLGIGSPAAGDPESASPAPPPHDVAVGASITAVNQALGAATQGGLANHQFAASNDQPLTYNMLDSEVGLGGPLATDRPVQVKVSLDVAPVALAAASTDPLATVRVRIAGLRVSAQFTDTGVSFLDFVADFDTDGTLTATPGIADLVLAFPSASATHIDVLDQGAGIPVTAGAGVFQVLEGDILGPLTSGLPVFALPQVAGVSLSGVSAALVGTSLVLYASLAQPAPPGLKTWNVDLNAATDWNQFTLANVTTAGTAPYSFGVGPSGGVVTRAAPNNGNDGQRDFDIFEPMGSTSDSEVRALVNPSTAQLGLVFRAQHLGSSTQQAGIVVWSNVWAGATANLLSGVWTGVDPPGTFGTNQQATSAFLGYPVGTFVGNGTTATITSPDTVDIPVGTFVCLDRISASANGCAKITSVVDAHTVTISSAASGTWTTGQIAYYSVPPSGEWIAAKLVGDQLTFKAWLPSEAEPPWNDPVHANTVTLPSSLQGGVAFPHGPGQDGVILSHLNVGETLAFSNLSFASLDP